jgi:hypothetical protein
MNSDIKQGISRIAIAGLVTYAANKGWIPMVDRDTLTSDLVSAVAIVGPAFWSYFHLKALSLLKG